MRQAPNRGRWDSRRKARTGAYVCSALAFLITVILAVWASTDKPLNGGQSALLVLLAGLLQVAASGLWSSAGRVHPSLARSAVRQLVQLGQRSAEATQVAEAVYETGKPGQQRLALGHMSVQWSYMTDGIALAIDNWVDIHPEAVGELVPEDQGE